MRFKIKVNHRDGRAPRWWTEYGRGSTAHEEEASVYTAEGVQDRAPDFWFNQDRDAGCDCWLSLKLVP